MNGWMKKPVAAPAGHVWYASPATTRWTSFLAASLRRRRGDSPSGAPVGPIERGSAIVRRPGPIWGSVTAGL